ncbi:hypothetical protein ACJX0J_006529, partial [Zea mays]
MRAVALFSFLNIITHFFRRRSVGTFDWFRLIISMVVAMQAITQKASCKIFFGDAVAIGESMKHPTSFAIDYSSGLGSVENQFYNKHFVHFTEELGIVNFFTNLLLCGLKILGPIISCGWDFFEAIWGGGRIGLMIYDIISGLKFMFHYTGAGEQYDSSLFFDNLMLRIFFSGMLTEVQFVPDTLIKFERFHVPKENKKHVHHIEMQDLHDTLCLTYFACCQGKDVTGSYCVAHHESKYDQRIYDLLKGKDHVTSSFHIQLRAWCCELEKLQCAMNLSKLFLWQLPSLDGHKVAVLAAPSGFIWFFRWILQ